MRPETTSTRPERAIPRARALVAAITIFSLAAGVSLAAGGPEPVSPGHPQWMQTAAGPCPTFSWTSSGTATGYELVIYEVEPRSDDLVERLRHRVPAGATSWSPSLDRCLERGGRYAWALRANGAKDSSTWSMPSLFEIAAAPSAQEFEAAVGVVREYLAANQPAFGEEPPHPHSQESAEATSRESHDAPDPATSMAPPGTELEVDGNVHAGSFTGDGSALDGVVTPGQLSTHVGNATAHHAPTVDTTCNGAACDGSQFNFLNASSLTAGTVTEARIDQALARDAELAAALEALDCPPGLYLAGVTGGSPDCLYLVDGGTTVTESIEVTIPDSGAASPYPSTLTVTSFGRPLADLNATLESLTHSYPADLDILLVAPTGEAVLLMSDGGGTNDLTNGTITFDDEALEALPIGPSLTSGTYRPADYLPGDTFPAPAPAGPYSTSLSTFDGIDPVGDWQLFIYDDSASDSGSLTDWSLELSGVATQRACEGYMATSRRFIDRGDGTVRDCLTGKIWLRDAGCLGAWPWNDAGDTIFTKIDDLNAGVDFGCSGYTAGTHADWEVPDIATLGSIVDSSIATNPRVYNGAGDSGWTPGNVFVDIQGTTYWSATEVDATNANSVGMNNGNTFSHPKSGARQLWAVRSD